MDLLRALQHAGPRDEAWKASIVEAYTEDYELFESATEAESASPRSIGRSESDSVTQRGTARRMRSRDMISTRLLDKAETKVSGGRH